LAEEQKLLRQWELSQKFRWRLRFAKEHSKIVTPITKCIN
jgi:hypothetical protein